MLQLKQLQQEQNFLGKHHFKKEMADLVSDAAPSLVTAADRKGPEAPCYLGRKLPKGCYTQLFPECISSNDIFITPSEPDLDRVSNWDQLMSRVNSQRHKELLELEEDPDKRHPPQYMCKHLLRNISHPLVPVDSANPLVLRVSCAASDVCQLQQLRKGLGGT